MMQMRATQCAASDLVTGPGLRRDISHYNNQALLGNSDEETGIFNIDTVMADRPTDRYLHEIHV